MDAVVVAMITGMVLLIMIAVATLHAQQSRQLQDIQTQLEAMGAESKRKEDGLRFQRTELLDPISQLEIQLVTQERTYMTDSELALVLRTREQVKQVTEELKQIEGWRGAPYDLEWAQYLDRVPVLKSLYMRADLEPPEVVEEVASTETGELPSTTPLPPVTSGS